MAGSETAPSPGGAATLSSTLSPQLREQIESAIARRRAIGPIAWRRHDLATLRPRQPLAKQPSAMLAVAPEASGRLVIKFKDAWRVSVIDGRLISEAGRDLSVAQGIAERAGLVFSPAIAKNRARLAQLEVRAAIRSGVSQPWLSGFAYLDGDGGVPVEVARTLNELDHTGAEADPVEFLHYEPNYRPSFRRTPRRGDGGRSSGGGTRSCGCVSEVPSCSEPLCADLVCLVDPFCCGVQWPGRGEARWDGWCVDHALELCDGLFGGGGGAPMPPFAPSDQPTPSLADAQGYLSPLGYVQEYGVIPDNVAYALKYDGEGYYSTGDLACEDPDGNPHLLDGYTGEGFRFFKLRELAEFLHDNGVGEVSLRGRGQSVGVLEPTAFVSTTVGPDAPYMHEDLHGKVIPEKGFSPLIIPGTASDGHHGTATLGILGAIDHDAAGNPVMVGAELTVDESRAEEVGMVGLVSEAALYYFPTVAVETGGRMIDAMASALEFFGPGDVLSYSIGPAGCGTLESVPSTFALLRLGSDLGVISCIAAGNECCVVGGGGSGAIIVGAVFPGCDNADADLLYTYATTEGFNCYCRAPFSNHGPGVHISAWGMSVATCGYGDLFVGDSSNDVNRAYTATFGGTSAATPMIASIAAMLQGFAKQFYGIYFSPEMIRSVLVGNGYLQCGGVLTGDHRDQLGLPCADIGAAGDWDPSAAPNLVGVGGVAFPDLFEAGVAIIKGNWFDGSGLITGIHILKGTRILGNHFSIKRSENLYLIVESEYQAVLAGGEHPLHPNYGGHGQWIDVVIESDVDIAKVGGLGVVVEGHVNEGVALVLVEMFNWQTGRYDFLGITLWFTADPLIPPVFAPFYDPRQYVRPVENTLFIRVAALSLGGQAGGLGGQGVRPFRGLYDVVSPFLSDQDIGDIFDPP